MHVVTPGVDVVSSRMEGVSPLADLVGRLCTVLRFTLNMSWCIVDSTRESLLVVRCLRQIWVAACDVDSARPSLPLVDFGDSGTIHKCGQRGEHAVDVGVSFTEEGYNEKLYAGLCRGFEGLRQRPKSQNWEMTCGVPCRFEVWSQQLPIYLWSRRAADTHI